MADNSTAKSKWERADSSRSGLMQRVREACRLTIPGMIPEDGDEDAVEPTPYQSLGARGVNNLASKLLLALFPAGQSFFRMTLSDSVTKALGGDTDVQRLMADYEGRVLKR